MHPTTSFDAFEATAELEKKTLSLPVEELGKFMEVDISETYSQNIDSL